MIPPRAPHPTIPGYYGQTDERSQFVRFLFDRTARHYDRVNAVMSLGSGARYRRQALAGAGLTAGARLLDIAVGTGLTAREARRLVGEGGRVVGLDSSAGMLLQAQRSDAAHDLVQGRAEALPFADASFDVVSMGYALRHVDDLVVAFAECRRVLRPGGTVIVLELVRPQSAAGRAVARAYLGHCVPLAALIATGSGQARTLMRYYWETIERCVAPEVVVEAMRHVGLVDGRYEDELGILRRYLARRA